MTAIYFSVVTIATVGYGDITPKSGPSRLLVSLEIVIGVAFTIVLFSIAATFVRELLASKEHRER